MSQLTTATETFHQPTNNGKTHTVSKKRTPYQKEAKNAQALNQISNWLAAAGIEAQRSTTPGCDLVVKKNTGEAVEVKVGITTDEARPAVEHLFILASELTHRQRQVAIRAFHQITEATGHGHPAAISRGEDPTKKLSFEDNFEMVAMRHKEFRKVPNPSAADLAHYEKVIAKAVSRFLYINTKICRRHGIEFEDLKTYAQIWTCNYLGLYKVSNPTNNDNERKLYTHLCQRFGNFVEVLLKKERNCIPDSQTASVALFGRPYEGGRIGTGRRIFQQEAELSFEEAHEADLETELAEEFQDYELSFDPLSAAEDLSAAAEEEREQQISDAKRRKAAQAQLKAEFDKLDHETLTFLLEEAAVNGALCPDARSEAKKQLRLHREACASCAQAQNQAGEG